MFILTGTAGEVQAAVWSNSIYKTKNLGIIIKMKQQKCSNKSF